MFCGSGAQKAICAWFSRAFSAKAISSVVHFQVFFAKLVETD
jgi:hypothetical protein